MTRIAVIFAIGLAACDVGDVTHHMGGPDGGGSGSGCINMATPQTPHPHAVGGTSNAGQNCMAAGCHDPAPGTQGLGASPWTFAGTLYTTTAGTTGAGGATIRIKFGTTVVKSIATDTDGNFYGQDAITFGMAMTDASSCPSIKMMTTALQTGDGACSKSGCHVAGGNPGPMSLQ